MQYIMENNQTLENLTHSKMIDVKILNRYALVIPFSQANFSPFPHFFVILEMVTSQGNFHEIKVRDYAWSLGLER